MGTLSVQKEVSLLRSAVISLIAERDPEGEYRPEFIKSTFAALSDKPLHRFTTPEKFLAHIRKRRS